MRVITLIQADAPTPRKVKAPQGPEDDMRGGDLLMRVELDKTKAKRAMEEAGRVADGYFAKAQRYMREGDYHNAIQYGKLAISYNEEDARYYFMLADCQVPEAQGVGKAEVGQYVGGALVRSSDARSRDSSSTIVEPPTGDRHRVLWAFRSPAVRRPRPGWARDRVARTAWGATREPIRADHRHGLTSTASWRT